MQRVFNGWPVVVFLTVAACTAGAQVTAIGTTEHIPPHQYQPYTAEFKITQVQTLADGTTITHEGSEIRARNSAGISMQSNTNADWQIGRIVGTSGGVHDTDGTILANWYSVTGIGHIFKMPPQDQRHGCWASASGSLRMDWNPRSGPPPRYVFNPVTRTAEQIQLPIQRSKPKVDELGMVSIQGVEARGQRISRTISAGEAGNDRTIITVEENWVSPSLDIELRQSIEDPRTGSRTRELVSLALQEPDPSLFQPPPDYKITTEQMHEVPCSQ